MTIYDISQEVFSCRVFPGDPAPERRVLSSMEKGDLYNLTAFNMCAHNGTHVDAPFHFIKGGKTIDAVGLEAFVGPASVTEHHGIVSGHDAMEIYEKSRDRDPEAAKRLLIKGDAVVSSEAAKVFASKGILLLGNESQTVGPEDAPMEVHLILLGAGIVLLEGIRLAAVKEGRYFLSAAPLNLSGADGSPCRAFLITDERIKSSLQVRKMKYRLPEINDKDILQKYVQEHHNNGETSISASLGLSSSDYTEWVTKIKNNALSGDEQWGKSLLYLCFDGDRLIGLLSVRYELPEVLSEKYGDIGYGVRPSERNKGYATAMLKYALSVCKEKGMEKVILGCYKENLASAATIQKNGGTLIAENENYKEGRTSQYYLIRL